MQALFSTFFTTPHNPQQNQHLTTPPPDPTQSRHPQTCVRKPQRNTPKYTQWKPRTRPKRRRSANKKHKGYAGEWEKGRKSVDCGGACPTPLGSAGRSTPAEAPDGHLGNRRCVVCKGAIQRLAPGGHLLTPPEINMRLGQPRSEPRAARPWARPSLNGPRGGRKPPSPRGKLLRGPLNYPARGGHKISPRQRRDCLGTGGEKKRRRARWARQRAHRLAWSAPCFWREGIRVF